MNLKIKVLFFLAIVFFSFSCNKEQLVTPEGVTKERKIAFKECEVNDQGKNIVWEWADYNNYSGSPQLSPTNEIAASKVISEYIRNCYIPQEDLQECERYLIPHTPYYEYKGTAPFFDILDFGDYTASGTSFLKNINHTDIIKISDHLYQSAVSVRNTMPSIYGTGQYVIMDVIVGTTTWDECEYHQLQNGTSPISCGSNWWGSGNDLCINQCEYRGIHYWVKIGKVCDSGDDG